MTRYKLLLISTVCASLLAGCDGACCGDVNQTKNSIKEYGGDTKLIPPAVKFTITDVIHGNCTAGKVLTLQSQSTDSDGTIIENIWEQDQNLIDTTTITCPEEGKTSTICLTSTDNDNQKAKSCQTITGIKDTNDITQKPLSLLTLPNDGDTGDGQYIDCSDIKDADNIRTYPDDIYLYGSNTPKDIKTVTWEYTYIKADGSIESGPTIQTQAQYNAENNEIDGQCKKWFHTGNGVTKIDIKFTTFDDDHESNTTNYIFDVDSHTLQQL